MAEIKRIFKSVAYDRGEYGEIQLLTYEGELVASVRCWPVETMIPIETTLMEHPVREFIELFGGPEQRRMMRAALVERWGESAMRWTDEEVERQYEELVKESS